MTFRLASLVSLIFCVVCSASLPLTAVDSGLSVSEVAAAEGKQGWTSQPNERGTIDIITSCGITMFLCSWSVICLNVPGPDDSKFRLFRRKAYITALAFIGPEFLFQIALGQLVSARRSVKDFHASGYKQWTITHAFYADMGGFILHTKDWLPFPINAKQLHYLVIKGYVKLPELERETINDKNKVDILLRLITVFQILWFVINMAGRAAQELAITCGELTTAAFIVCSIGTTLCWIYKPADVLRPEIIETDVTISEILLKAGERAREPYSNTPLDFVSRKEWVWSIYWSNWINILRNLGIIFSPQIRPINRFENTICHELSGIWNYIFLGVTAIYASIFICGWNYSFPTYTELILWRAASVTIMATLVAYWAISEFGFSLYPAVQRRFANDALVPSHPKKTPQQKQQVGCHWLTLKVRSVASSIRNNSVYKDPALSVPLKTILPIYVVAVFYCHARTYLLIADIIQLRSLPATAYSTVDWLQVIPHF
jgi:hypothetical protein